MWNSLADVIPESGCGGGERGRMVFLCHSQNLVNKHSSKKVKRIDRKQTLLNIRIVRCTLKLI